MSESKPLFYNVFHVICCHFLVSIRMLKFNITVLTDFFCPSHSVVLNEYDEDIMNMFSSVFKHDYDKYSIDILASFKHQCEKHCIYILIPFYYRYEAHYIIMFSKSCNIKHIGSIKNSEICWTLLETLLNSVLIRYQDEKDESSW